MVLWPDNLITLVLAGSHGPLGMLLGEVDRMTGSAAKLGLHY